MRSGISSCCVALAVAISLLAPAARGSGIDVVADWEYRGATGLVAGEAWPEPTTGSFGVGVLAVDGWRSVELVMFPVFNGGVGGPELVRISSRLPATARSSISSEVPEPEICIVPSVLFHRQREMLLGLGIELDWPASGALVVSSDISTHLQLGMSPRLRFTGLSFSATVGVEARVPLTYQAEWEESFLEGARLAPFALPVLYVATVGWLVAIWTVLALLL